MRSPLAKAKKEAPSSSSSNIEEEALKHLRQALAEGKHWYIALLETVGLWEKAEEDFQGRHYRYLIDGEAFDWLLLAERLCGEIGEVIPEGEKEALLFEGKPPLEIPREEFHKLLGNAKYRAYLNYFYGITVEEALQTTMAVQVRKERQGQGTREQEIQDIVNRRIYGASEKELLEHFEKEKGYPRRRSLDLSQRKEFTYWLFKHRLQLWDKARVASDTKRGLEFLRRQRALKKASPR